MLLGGCRWEDALLSCERPQCSTEIFSASLKSETSDPAADRRRAAVQDVRVDHGGAHVTVSEQFLDRTNVVAVFEEMRREGVPEGVTRGSLGQARLEDGFLDSPLEHGLMEVMPAPLAGDAIDVETGRREGPLPAPLAARVGILPPECPRQLDPAGAVLQVPGVLCANPLEVTHEVGLHDIREQPSVSSVASRCVITPIV